MFSHTGYQKHWVWASCNISVQNSFWAYSALLKHHTATQISQKRLKYIPNLKAMKWADWSCKHRQAVKNMQCEKTLFKSHLQSSRLGKRVEKHETSTNQKMAASMKSLLVCLLLKKRKWNRLSYCDIITGIPSRLFSWN